MKAFLGLSLLSALTTTFSQGKNLGIQPQGLYDETSNPNVDAVLNSGGRQLVRVKGVR